MLRYTCYQKNPASHYIYIDLQISDIQTDTLRLHLPVWRPGRYELGNFARNLKKLQLYKSCKINMGSSDPETKSNYSYLQLLCSRIKCWSLLCIRSNAVHQSCALLLVGRGHGI